jgi:hypothetical protein
MALAHPPPLWGRAGARTAEIIECAIAGLVA